ncbi:oxygenase MpaB family protein [Corynebacterium pelargi]|uniref:ER-bound oxygenase mpaB/mpaB'/Rubber oxygenase catalytic domain-containing protein n=1 Tax=Corynebacterium pelargi TaxID=1471400 RepID=A0A410W7N2_9CORY|nr:oxygenase MpaB family protein [Corynebacterium pelargi]QAU51966.1 hypothetical protein CPELA_03435 [Corynebacterium pelargi]GGG71106.1 hypothetical protein GCM10007338_05120 [Corynebacterium pelargi]
MTAPYNLEVLPRSENPYEDYRYFYRDGMPLRPAPERRTEKPSWSTLRHNLFDRWHDVKDDWSYNNPQTLLLDDHMWQTDEQGAAVAEMFKRVGAQKGRADFEIALNQGIDKVENPEPELVELFKQIDNIPSWIDLEAAERGRVAYYNVTPSAELLSIAFAYWATAMEDRTSAATAETAMFENQAMQRVLETVKFFVDLGRDDVFDRYSPGLKAAVRVRIAHAQANRGLERLWGPEHYNTYGRPIGSSFLVSGEGWFALMPIAVDEFFGRPHSGQEWDDVAMYWAYVLYMMGAEERIIPKTGDEMRKMTDFIYANGGMSSSYRVQIANALMGVLEELDEKLPVNVLAALSTIIGEHDTRYMVRGTKWEDAKIKLIAKAFTAKAKAEALAYRIKDQLPGAEERKIRKAHDGKPPWMDILEVQEKHIRENKLKVDVTYALHDESEVSKH